MDRRTLMEVVYSAIILVLGLFLGTIMYFQENKYLEELSEIRSSDVVGVLGTTYALITAFILVTVWNHFTHTSSIFAQEIEAIISLWNYTDFLDDPAISEGMMQALLDYLEFTQSIELVELSNRNQILIPSKQFLEIIRVLDKIKFDDKRDPIVYEAMISSFKSLSIARTNRIEASLASIPWLLKMFYMTASFIFWFGYLIEGFDSQLLYFIVLVMFTIIVVFSYVIIFDLDRPLQGFIRVETERYTVCADYIKKTEHKIDQAKSKT